MSALPLPVLLDVERAGETHTLVVTLDGAILLVEKDGRLGPWADELGGAELAIAWQRLERAAFDRERRSA